MLSTGRRSERRNVCLLSPHPLVLRELQQMLEGPRLRLQIQRLTPTLAPHLERLARASVYVVDAHLPRPAAEAVIASILERFPRSRLLVLADEFSEVNAFPLLRLGVKGLVLYAEAREKLAHALEAVAKGGIWVPRSLVSRFMDSIVGRKHLRPLPAPPAAMSGREREVLEALLDNQSNKEIAAKLHISERTVKFHVSNLLGKFGFERRQELILNCLQLSQMAS